MTKKKKRRKRLLFIGLLAGLLYLIAAIPEMMYHNQGESQSIGSVRDGQLENPYLLPYSGPNFRYFSPFSYYILNNAYTTHQVYQTILRAYEICAETCPGTFFRMMEASNKDGGKMWVHWTHQNGMSMDYMVVKKRKEKQVFRYDRIGLLHYLWEFSDDGRLRADKKTVIDFELTARHILATQQAARENGLRIRKVLLKIELKDDLFNTPSGKKLKESGVYFAHRLYPIVNKLHDDHYHIDFEPIIE